jgi:hypothetical protein
VLWALQGERGVVVQTFDADVSLTKIFLENFQKRY